MKIAIAGYGNLAKIIEKQIVKNADFELAGIFTRRNTLFVNSELNSPINSFSVISRYCDKVDVMINCMGSANDLPVTTPYLAKYFNLIDCFDNSKLLKSHISKTNRYASEGKKLALVGCGMNTVLNGVDEFFFFASSLENVKEEIFQSGVSATHTNALRNIDGVAEAVVNITGSFSNPQYNCIVVPYSSDDRKRIRYEIMSLTDYFENKSIDVSFVDIETFKNMYNNKSYSFNAKLVNNSGGCLSMNFTSDNILNETASLALAYSKAVYKMNQKGITGCIIPSDVESAYLK